MDANGAEYSIQGRATNGALALTLWQQRCHNDQQGADFQEVYQYHNGSAVFSNISRNLKSCFYGKAVE